MNGSHSQPCRILEYSISQYHLFVKFVHIDKKKEPKYELIRRNLIQKEQSLYVFTTANDTQKSVYW